MKYYQNRIRREYLRHRTRRETVLGAFVFVALILAVGISCSSGSDMSVEDLEGLISTEAAAKEAAASDEAAMMELYGWDDMPAVMVAHRVERAPEVVVTVAGEPELVQVVKR